MAGSLRALCRTSGVAPLRRPTLRAPTVHPATGLPLSKRKGQHIIHNKGVLNKIIEAADIRSADAVYEVGCGTGELTVPLLQLARRVHTVDIEARMVSETECRASQLGLADRLDTAVGDALKLQMPRRFDICVSNLPYQISSPFIFQLLRRLCGAAPWRSAVLMLQREYAERLLADPGERPFSRLSMNVRLFARVERLFDVKAGSFIPQPLVQSTVVRLVPRLPPPDVHFSEWDAMVRLIFWRRKKTLRTVFTSSAAISKLERNYKLRCSLVGESPSRQPFPQMLLSVLEEQGVLFERGYAMEVSDLHSLSRAFHRRGIYFSDIQGAQDPDGRLLFEGPSTVLEDDGSATNPLALARPGGASAAIQQLGPGVGGAPAAWLIGGPPKPPHPSARLLAGRHGLGTQISYP